jgi:hypothetical protein
VLEAREKWLGNSGLEIDLTAGQILSRTAQPVEEKRRDGEFC